MQIERLAINLYLCKGYFLFRGEPQGGSWVATTKRLPDIHNAGKKVGEYERLDQAFDAIEKMEENN